jgi:outer membrane cobalamin receptor
LENLKLSGKHILSKYLLLDWAGIFSLATKRAPDRSDLVINTKIDTVHTTNNISGPYTFRKTPYYFDDIPRLWQHNKDIDYDFITNATYKTHIKENALEFKAGGLYRHKERSNRADQYDLKPSANADGSKQYFTNIYTAQWLVFNPTGNGNFNANDYDAHENIIAGFGQAKFVSNNFELFGGIRVENTDQAFNIQSESYTQITHATITYLDVLPSVMFKYKVTTKSSIRIAYNKSLSRPNYYELVPYVIPSNTTSNDEAGNPGLKHAIADNFDVRYELFPKGEEEILIGAFYKQIQDPIEYVYVNNTTYSPENLGNATIGGIELSCTKYWGIFGLTGNYTYIKSTVSSPKSYTDLVAGTTIQKLQSRPMQGQTDNTLNISLLYKNEKKKVFVQLAYQYLGKSLSLVYPIYGADYYQQPQSSLSLSAEKDLNKHFIVFGKFNNLLNTSTTTKINNLIGINDSFRPSYTLGLRYSY